MKSKSMQVLIKRPVVDSILSYAKMCHPREGILLLRGRAKGDVIKVEEVLIPPLSIRGNGFSSFPPHMPPRPLNHRCCPLPPLRNSSPINSGSKQLLWQDNDYSRLPIYKREKYDYNKR